MIRPRALAAGTGMSRTVDSGDFWQGQTETVQALGGSNLSSSAVKVGP